MESDRSARATRRQGRRSLASPRATPRPRGTAAADPLDHGARASLLESYLACPDDPVRCGRLTLAWLARHAGLDDAIVLVVDRAARRLRVLAASGGRRPTRGWPLAARRHPLVSALAATTPVTVSADGTRGAEGRTLPLACPFIAVPLRAGTTLRRADGLLLLPDDQAAPATVAWAAGVFGRVLARALARRATGTRRRLARDIAGPRTGDDRRPGVGERQARDQRRRDAEVAVRTERARLDLIIDSVADPIIVTGRDGATMLMNAPAEQIFRLPAGGGAAARRHVEENDARFSAFIGGLLRGDGPGPIRRGELVLRNPSSGEPVPVEAIAGTVLAAGTDPTAVVTILHDRREALERARLYEQLKLASDELQARVQAATAELATQNELLRRQALELEEASRLKSQFLANMSHEFRTPLNAILGYTHMLLQGVAGDLLPAVKRQLQRIDANGRHLLTLINEILDITRIEAGKMPMQLSTFNLNELIPEVMAELDAVIGRSKLLVTSRLSAADATVFSDRQKVKQVIVNLLSNALKFTHEGAIQIAVDVSRVQGTAVIEVADTGIGIAPENHDRIFEDFRQLDDSPSRQYSGTGLGLAICRRLAHALGGRIALSSSLGRGSTFTLTIPVHTEQ